MPIRSSSVIFAMAAALASFAARPATAQIPAHATRINPSLAIRFPIWTQSGDAVLAFDRNGRHYSRSADGGRTWPTIEQSLGNVWIQDVAQEGSTLVAAAKTAGPGLGDLAVVTSQDHGATWSQPNVIGTFQANPGSGPAAAMIGAAVFVAWTETTTGDVWLQRSLDRGATWLPAPQRIATTATTLSNLGMNLSLLVEGGTLHVFWNGGATAQGWMQTTDDLGTTWLQVPRATPTFFDLRRAAAVGGKLFLASSSPLYVSADRGQTWTTVAGMTSNAVADIAVDGATMAVVGRDTVAPFQVPVWSLEVSTDEGASWSAPLNLSSAVGFTPSAHVVGQDVYVDFSHNVHEWGLLVHSSDQGVSWRQLESGVGAFVGGPERNIHVRRVGTFQLAQYAYVGAGFSTVGAGTPGTGGATPTLGLDDLPLLGRTVGFAVTDAVGGFPGVLGMTLDAPAPTPLLGGTLWLTGTVALQPFATSGAPGAAGSGDAAVPFAVPNDPTLAGLGFTAQAAVLDPGAAANFAWTRAIEVWIR